MAMVVVGVEEEDGGNGRGGRKGLGGAELKMVVVGAEEEEGGNGGGGRKGLGGIELRKAVEVKKWGAEEEEGENGEGGVRKGMGARLEDEGVGKGLGGFCKEKEGERQTRWW